MAIEELDYDWRAHQESARDNKNLAIRFYMEAVPDEVASQEAGRPVYKDVEFIEKRVRGDRNNIVQRPVYAEDKETWPDLYRAFKAGEEMAISGTPLAEWPSLPKSLVLELKHMGFTTVEHVANATDSVCAKFAGLQGLKQRAVNYIAQAKGEAPVLHLQAKVEDQANELETLRRQVQEQSAMIKALSAKEAAKA